MSQLSSSDAEYAGKRRHTRREMFLAEMEQVVPWKMLLKPIEPFYPMAGRGRHPSPLGGRDGRRVRRVNAWSGGAGG